MLQLLLGAEKSQLSKSAWEVTLGEHQAYKSGSHLGEPGALQPKACNEGYNMGAALAAATATATHGDLQKMLKHLIDLMCNYDFCPGRKKKNTAG